MTRSLRLLAAIAVVAFVGAVTAAAPADVGAARPFCGITWGSLQKARSGGPGAPITAIRTGRHRCYDRLVIDLAGRPSGHRVDYGQVSNQGTGDPVAVRGGAALEITVLAPAYDLDGRPTVSLDALPSVAGYRTFRQVVSGGSFEGYTTIGLGVRARLPFRVFTLNGPGAGSRLVIDVAHRW